MTRPRLRRCAGIVSLVLVASGCTGTDAPADARRGGGPPTYAEAECPRDVSIGVVGEIRCGTLSVPEDREDGTGEVRLLVSTLVPPDITQDEPILVLGLDTRFNYSGIAPVAQRTSSEVIILEPRGVGHSEPSLDCDPAAPPVTWRDRTGSAEWREGITAWAAECHDALTAQGIEPAAYGVEDLAADAADLLDALDLEQVNVITYGSSGRVALELVRGHSDRVRALVLDTPELPGVDHRGYAAATTLTALRRVLSWCERDLDCRRRHPDPSTLLERALRAVDTDPVPVRVPSASGAERVLLDAGLLVRVARQATTDGGSSGPWALPTALPRLLEAVVARDRGRLSGALAQLLGRQGPLCPGYRPKCSPAHGVSEGVAATVLCGDVAAGEATRARATTALPGFDETFDAAWWGEICEVWPVDPPAETGPVTSAVPTLAFVPGLATVPPRVVREQLAGLTNLSVVTVPTAAHNVMGSDCTVEVRNAWLQDPEPTSTPACIDRRLEW